MALAKIQALRLIAAFCSRRRIIFAFAYSFFFINWLNKISNTILRGTIFGIITFIFAQIIIATMGAMMGGMPGLPAGPAGSSRKKKKKKKKRR